MTQTYLRRMWPWACVPGRLRCWHRPQGCGTCRQRGQSARAPRGVTSDLQVSIGVACAGRPSIGADALVRRADAAMYASKRRGRRAPGCLLVGSPALNSCRPQGRACARGVRLL